MTDFFVNALFPDSALSHPFLPRMYRYLSQSARETLEEAGAIFPRGVTLRREDELEGWAYLFRASDEPECPIETAWEEHQ